MVQKNINRQVCRGWLDTLDFNVPLACYAASMKMRSILNKCTDPELARKAQQSFWEEKTEKVDLNSTTSLNHAEVSQVQEMEATERS